MPSCAGIGQVLRNLGLIREISSSTPIGVRTGASPEHLEERARLEQAFGRTSTPRASIWKNEHVSSPDQVVRLHRLESLRHQYPTDCSKRGTDRKLRASTTQSTHQFVYLSHPLRFLSAAKNKAPFLDSRSIHKILVPSPYWRKRERRPTCGRRPARQSRYMPAIGQRLMYGQVMTASSK